MRRGPLPNLVRRTQIIDVLERTRNLRVAAKELGISRQRVYQVAQAGGFDMTKLVGHMQRRIRTDKQYAPSIAWLLGHPRESVRIVAKKFGIHRTALVCYIASRRIKRPKEPCLVCGQPLGQFRSLGMCTSCTHTTRGMYVCGVARLFRQDQKLFRLVLQRLQGLA